MPSMAPRPQESCFLRCGDLKPQGFSAHRHKRHAKLGCGHNPIQAQSSQPPVGAKTTETKRVFHALESYRRLTINLTRELHKKLKQAALDADCTATDIVEKMLLAKSARYE